MSVNTIMRAAEERKLFSDRLHGKTLNQTLKSKLTLEIRRFGKTSTFVRTRPGRFYLRRLLEGATEYVGRAAVEPRYAESVVCIPSRVVRQILRHQGLLTGERARKAARLLLNSAYVVLPRSDAEFRTDHKQLLTYIMVTTTGRILAYRRGAYSNAEKYLKGQMCVGFGGHVTEADTATLFRRDPLGVVVSAARELREELVLPMEDSVRIEDDKHLQFVGIINDDTSTTGQCHLALVYRYEVSRGPHWDVPRANERSVQQIHWIDPARPKERLSNFEYWSQLCLLRFYKAATIAQPYCLVRRPARLREAQVLLVVGKIGSGKSVVARAIARARGVRVINSGSVVAQLFGTSNVTEETRQALQQQALTFISRKDGPDRLAAAIADRCESTSRGCVIDGIRQVATAEALRRRLRPMRVAVVYAFAPMNLAFEFYSRRSKRATIEEFLRAINDPVEKEVEYFLSEADAVVYNWRGLRALESAVQEIVEAGTR